MQKEVNPVLVIAVVVVLVVGIVGALVYFTSPHTPPGVKYTPGVPPWKNGQPYQPWQGIKQQGQSAGPMGVPATPAGSAAAPGAVPPTGH
ncbi:MAG TPA: hypothetical protein VKV18_02130 [Chthonomonas sp.]|uniref:hypothetical protein n=1 Tax=Chthonomonas sp. TaxID=2282153 RepID=UPI002B4AE309|nr:hypothetical protein [Chthonomonas sp.]HLI47477.1 hypothetical protein [Chthonomonas sp.]